MQMTMRGGFVPCFLALALGCGASVDGSGDGDADADADTDSDADAPEWEGIFEGQYLGDSESALTMELECAAGSLNGTANDIAGDSSITNGTCSADDVQFVKRYVGGKFDGLVNHYVGTREGGHLEGTWTNVVLNGTWFVDRVQP